MTDHEIVKALAEKVMGVCHNGREWKPLTSIADAWMIVERMYELGYSFEIGRYKHGCSSPLIEAPRAIFTGDKLPKVSAANASTIQRAICIAALKAASA